MDSISKNSNDSELWQRLIRGEKDVIEMFYRRYYDLLFNYGLKYYSDDETIKDSIQDLFVRLYKSDHLSPTISVKAYLLKALKNIILDKLPKNQNKISIDEDYLDISIDDQYIERLFEKNDDDIYLSKQIVNSYQNLPKNQKMVIYLRYIKGLSHKEIAEIMAIKVQSSMNLSQRALTAIRKHLLQIISFFI